MQLEVGSIVQGKVSGITNFGAFIDIVDGKTGMVHISEISTDYVDKIADHLQLHQEVKVKILAVTPEGKISLSIRKAVPSLPKNNTTFKNNFNDRGFDKDNVAQVDKRKQSVNGVVRNNGSAYQQNAGKRSNPPSDNSFESMISKFKQTSDDKMYDLKKHIDVKRGSSNRKSNKP